MNSDPFSGRAVRWLIGIGVASLLASGLLAAFGGELSDVVSSGSDSFSRSALGQRAFVETLRGLGFQVVVSRHDTAARITPETVVVLAEPQIDGGSAERHLLRDIAGRAQRLLLVLPKRSGRPDLRHPAWISGADLIPTTLPRDVLGLVLDPDDAPESSAPSDEVDRVREVDAWTGDLPRPEIDGPQLVRSNRLTRLLWTRQGMLAGEWNEEGRQVVVLADPEVIQTHGLSRGANAEIAVRLLERLGQDRVVLLDETLHGHPLTPSLLRELLRYPVVLVTLHAALVAALLIWAGLVRFGRPGRPPPPFDPGKAFLMENTAALLRYGGHLAPAVAAYWRATQEQLESQLRAPGERSGARAEWLARTAAARGRGRELAALQRRVDGLANRPGAERQALQTALAIHRFREEMIHGAGTDPRAD